MSIVVPTIKWKATYVEIYVSGAYWFVYVANNYLRMTTVKLYRCY